MYLERQSEHDESPLKVGETVTYAQPADGSAKSGVILQRVSADYVRVKWSDLAVPTTQSYVSLKRIGIRRKH
jgi:hypothetical protein